MAFTMTRVGTPNKDEFDRLFQEALPYISKERQRLGEDTLKAGLWSALVELDSVVYAVDGYTVGMAALGTCVYDGQRYLEHISPTYGTDQNGSRSWWYHDDFQRLSADFVRDNNYVGIVTAFNPNTPASNAVKNHFGNIAGNYFNRPVEVPYEEIFSGPPAASEAKAMIITLRDDD